MPSLPREVLEDFVDRWLDANREAERTGDWRILADFYTDDATYGWNIGPKEDVMCVGINEIRDIALGQEMEGLEGWRYPYQRVVIDDKIGEVVGFWKQIAGGAGARIERQIPKNLRCTGSAAAGSASTATPRSNGSATSSTSGMSRRCTWT
jgi:hypothetical protein